MAQHAPFVAALGRERRHELLADAVAALGASPPVLVRSVIVLTASVPRGPGLRREADRSDAEPPGCVPVQDGPLVSCRGRRRARRRSASWRRPSSWRARASSTVNRQASEPASGRGASRQPEDSSARRRRHGRCRRSRRSGARHAARRRRAPDAARSAAAGRWPPARSGGPGAAPGGGAGARPWFRPSRRSGAQEASRSAARSTSPRVRALSARSSMATQNPSALASERGRPSSPAASRAARLGVLPGVECVPRLRRGSPERRPPGPGNRRAGAPNRTIDGRGRRRQPTRPGPTQLPEGHGPGEPAVRGRTVGQAVADGERSVGEAKRAGGGRRGPAPARATRRRHPGPPLPVPTCPSTPRAPRDRPPVTDPCTDGEAPDSHRLLGPWCEPPGRRRRGPPRSGGGSRRPRRRFPTTVPRRTGRSPRWHQRPARGGPGRCHADPRPSGVELGGRDQGDCLVEVVAGRDQIEATLGGGGGLVQGGGGQARLRPGPGVERHRSPVWCRSLGELPCGLPVQEGPSRGRRALPRGLRGPTRGGTASRRCRP